MPLASGTEAPLPHTEASGVADTVIEACVPGSLGVVSNDVHPHPRKILPPAQGESSMSASNLSPLLRFLILTSVLVACLIVYPPLASAVNTATNPICPAEEVFYNPGNGEDIIVPSGYKVEVFARDLHFPTGIAFRGNRNNFQVFVLESGTGLPGRCNNNAAVPLSTGPFDPDNPFTPGLVI